MWLTVVHSKYLLAIYFFSNQTMNIVLSLLWIFVLLVLAKANVKCKFNKFKNIDLFLLKLIKNLTFQNSNDFRQNLCSYE